jgi:polyisoprenyl-teichoic acid--peptidoglycan teichoic acid transferase
LNGERARGAQRGRSSSVAAFLSFLWPGAGQWYRGRRRAALLYALPVLAVAIVAIVQVLGSAQDVALQLFAPSFSLTILILIILLGLWRLVSMLDAATTRGGWAAAGRRTTSVLAVLAVVVIIVHGIGAYFAYSFYEAGSRIFVTEQPNEAVPGSGDPEQAPLVATPFATPPTRVARINVLLTGIDSGPGRNHSLNDTLIVASIDPISHKVAMVSFPRDIANFPLYTGGKYTDKINSLMSYAGKHKDKFPDGPVNTLTKELGYLVGAPIHYYAAVDLDGFRRLIDKVGGVDIDNPRQISDPVYGGWTDKRPIGFWLTPGLHHLDGQSALAYVRSRMGSGDSDFSRARRQQQLLVALARKLSDPRMFTRLPDLLTVAGDTVRTNFPSDRLAEMINLTQGVSDKSITQIVLGPPYSVRPKTKSSTYTLELVSSRLAAVSLKVFGAESAYSGLPPGTFPPAPGE